MAPRRVPISVSRQRRNLHDAMLHIVKNFYAVKLQYDSRLQELELRYQELNENLGKIENKLGGQEHLNDFEPHHPNDEATGGQEHGPLNDFEPHRPKDEATGRQEHGPLNDFEPHRPNDEATGGQEHGPLNDFEPHRPNDEATGRQEHGPLNVDEPHLPNDEVSGGKVVPPKSIQPSRSPELGLESAVVPYKCLRCEELFKEKWDNLLLYDRLLNRFAWNHAMDVRGLRRALKEANDKYYKKCRRNDELIKENSTLKRKIRQMQEYADQVNYANVGLYEKLEEMLGRRPKRRTCWQGFKKFFVTTAPAEN